MVTIKISTANEAFSADPGYEVGRILRRLAQDVESGVTFDNGEEIKLRDINGNTVGSFKYTTN